MARNHADLKLAIDHAALDRVQRRHIQVQIHLGCQLGKKGDRRAESGLRVAGRLVKDGNIELPAHAAVDFVDAGAKGVGTGQQTQGLGIDLLTFGCQGESRASAPAKGQAKPGFEVLDVATDSGAADIEFQLRRRHAAALDHALEHAQQADVHVTKLTQG